MPREKIIEKVLSLGLSRGMHDFLKSEADLRGLSVTDVVRVAIHEMWERRKDLEAERFAKEAAYLAEMRKMKD